MKKCINVDFFKLLQLKRINKNKLNLSECLEEKKSFLFNFHQYPLTLNFLN
jgi:hypothetical protein